MIYFIRLFLVLIFSFSVISLSGCSSYMLDSEIELEDNSKSSQEHTFLIEIEDPVSETQIVQDQQDQQDSSVELLDDISDEI